MRNLPKLSTGPATPGPLRRAYSLFLTNRVVPLRTIQMVNTVEITTSNNILKQQNPFHSKLNDKSHNKQQKDTLDQTFQRTSECSSRGNAASHGNPGCARVKTGRSIEDRYRISRAQCSSIIHFLHSSLARDYTTSMILMLAIIKICSAKSGQVASSSPRSQVPFF